MTSIKIELSGVVANGEYFEGEVIDLKKVTKQVNNSDKDIHILLNSSGGDVFEGVAIYNYLKHLKNHVTIEITSLAASAASLIAMGADKIIIRNGASMMIHEASTWAMGTKSDIKKTLNALETIDQSIIDIYHARTGIEKDVIEQMLIEETWLTADKAKELKFVDDISGRTSSKEVVKMANELKFSATQLQKILNAVEEYEIEEVEKETEELDTEALSQRMDDLEARIEKLENKNKPPVENKVRKLYI